MKLKKLACEIAKKVSLKEIIKYYDYNIFNETGIAYTKFLKEEVTNKINNNIMNADLFQKNAFWKVWSHSEAQSQSNFSTIK